MNIEALKAFVRTAETGSFSATGRMLGKSQAAISKLIANLEIDLNGELFDRSGKYPTLTDFGLAIYERCQYLIEQESAIKQMAEALTNGQEAEIRLGIDSAVKSEALDNTIADLINEFEHLVIELREAPAQILLEELVKEQLDLVLVPQLLQRIDGLQILTSYPLSFVALANKHHPLSQRQQVSLVDLKSYTAFSFAQVRAMIDSSFRTSLRHCYANDPKQLASLAAKANGFAFVPELMATELCEQYQLKQLPLAANIANADWQMELIAVEAFTPRRGARRFIELLNLAMRQPN